MFKTKVIEVIVWGYTGFPEQKMEKMWKIYRIQIEHENSFLYFYFLENGTFYRQQTRVALF